MSINILLADDSITIQKVIGIIFGGDEYSVTVVDNGKAAVDKAIEIKPDVLLIDALMPGMSGYEVCEQIRGISELKSKPIILLTGSFEPFDEEKAKSCGADTFLSKPFESQQIVNKVAEMFELGKSRESAPEFAGHEAAVTPPPLPVEPVVDTAAAPNDIWGAFTPPAETLESHEEADESATVSVDPEEKIDLHAEQTGSQWIPVEEHTFEFEEEIQEEALENDSPPTDEAEEDEDDFIAVSSDEPAELMSHEEAPAETAFTEKAMPEILASIPTFEEPGKTDFVRSAAMSVVHPGPATESYTPELEPAPASAAPSAMTEEQLRAAISLVSKDVIERIVWEVVPDLAEEMIKEAIRRIKEGQ